MDTNRKRWLLVWFLAILPLLGWWMYGLFDVDEGFYGAVTAEMNRRHEWITPFYNGKPWFEKPILLYWLAKPCLAAFGDMFGPRLPSIVCTVATYATVAWFAGRRYGTKVAQLATLMLAGSLLVVGTGRMMMTDMPLLACLTGAFITFWESLVGKPSWRVLTAGLLGLGVLAKGPVALILFVLVAGWTYWREKDLRPSFKGHWSIGTVVLVAVIATWYVPAYLANGNEFVQKFLIDQNIGRFTGGDAAHTLGGFESLVLYIPVLFLGMFPWSLLLWRAWPRRNTPSDAALRLDRYLATWAAVVFLFFTASGAKLPHYILPAIPPLALLVAAMVARRSAVLKKWFVFAEAWCVASAAIANAGFMWWYQASGQAEAHEIARFIRDERQLHPTNDHPDVAIYKMGRQTKDLGTGKLKLQETALPSLLMYLDSTAFETDNFQTLLRSGSREWVITREGRITTADFVDAANQGYTITQAPTPFAQNHFRLYLLEFTNQQRL